MTFYDTFDWRLFDKGMVLSRTGDEWVVSRLPTGATLERLTIGSPPGFVWEIADSPLKQRVASIVEATAASGGRGDDPTRALPGPQRRRQDRGAAAWHERVGRPLRQAQDVA